MVDNLSASEFMEHYLFWQRFKWGLTDDLLALRVGQEAGRTRDLWKLKDYAVVESGKTVVRIVTSANSVIAKGFRMLCWAIGKPKDSK